ncbi:hypothetical protein Aperf_G00000032884 [Anoplocephala perfoliata]
MLETKEEVEDVKVSQRIIAEHIEAFYNKRKSQPNSPPLRSITNFDLETSGLRALPPQNVLGALPCLRILNLRNNKLRSLQGGLLQCRCLEELYIDDNYLTSIRDELKHLHCLKLLSARRNYIENVNDTVSELKQIHRIEQVDLRGNPIENEHNYALKMWKALPSLSVLDSRKKFTDGPSFAAVKIPGKHKETKTRNRRLSSDAKICERYRRSQLRRVYVTHQVQTDDTDDKFSFAGNMIMGSCK